MRLGKCLLWIICAALLTCVRLPALADQAWTDLAVLSTTDMHGRCWETNILTGEASPQNMLRVSTAVQMVRDTYGPEHVILLDNGDLFQGTPVSEDHLLRREHPEDEPEAMALCLMETGYDALVLGNHEFNFPWSVMRRVYDSLEAGGVSVLAANACYDGTDGIHEKGESAFGTYIVREVTVNGHIHRIGILGLENTDIAQWDLPANYPGIQFAHPDNPTCDLALEADRFIAQMRNEGCEMIIVAYHGGLGAAVAGEPLTYGENSEHQGLRIIQGTEHIDLMILGHDHSTSYSCTFATDRAGREVPIVNGGGQELTQTVFRLSENPEGGLVCELRSTENLSLSAFSPDATLEEKIRPYAELANAALDQPVGLLTGEWDGSAAYQTSQTDTMDLIAAAMIETGTAEMREAYDDAALQALQFATGLDHLDVDASLSSLVSGGYMPAAGPISTRDVYSMYRFANNLLVLPMHGRELRSILEENAADHLSCRVLGGKIFYFSKGNPFANLIAGGVNFHYDMAMPAGERVSIAGFSNGRLYDPDALYLVAVNSYNLGDDSTGLRRYSAEDALWSQLEDDPGDTLQDSICDYIAQKTEALGGVSPELFSWRWSLQYSGDPASLSSYPGKTAACRVDAPEDGHRYLLYLESEGCTLVNRFSSISIDAAPVAAWGDMLVDAIPENALIFTVSMMEDGALQLMDSQGRYLSCGPSGGLSLTKAPQEVKLSLWQAVPMDGGYCLLSVGAKNSQVLEYYNGHFSTYKKSSASRLLFNFYEIREGGPET